MKSWFGAIEQSRWAVVIPMAIAGVLGIATIGSKSMWLDEAFSASIIQLPTLDLVRYLFYHEMQASPYHLALQLWSALGHDETSLRLLSVVFGVVAVLATYALGKRFGVGLPAAMLLAVSPFFVHHEQEVRVYTLLVGWSAITTLAYLRLLDRPNRWRAAAYVVAALGLIYIHPLSGWMLVAHAVVRVRRAALALASAGAVLPSAHRSHSDRSLPHPESHPRRLDTGTHSVSHRPRALATAGRGGSGVRADDRDCAWPHSRLAA